MARTGPSEDFSVHPPPSMSQSTEELIEERKRKFERRRAYEEGRRSVRVDVEIPGPICLVHMGDPHVDDDGTDLKLLERDLEICRSTEGMFVGNLGDLHNNWVGRLGRLYSEQSTSAKEAWQLVEWLLESAPWLYIVGGNHDAWSGAGDPVRWITQRTGSYYEEDGVRLELVFPGCERRVTVNARHNWSGHSQWNPNHGAMKNAQMGFRDDVLVGAHTHVSGYSFVVDPSDGKITHCVTVGGYKIYDRYARRRGLRRSWASPSFATVFDPWAEDPAEIVTPFLSLPKAATFITALRSEHPGGRES